MKTLPLERRKFLFAAALAAISPASFLLAERWKPLFPKLGELEKRSGGRLGWAVLDTATGQRFAHRGGERFPMCSTFKFLAVGYVLHRVDQGKEDLDRSVAFTKKDVVAHSPVTESYAGASGMTLGELCKAAMTESDNTAANLLLASFGGPAGLNEFLVSIGDTKTHLDRTEPALNEAAPGDERDTTTPSAMLENMRRILLGDVLKPSSVATLTDWLIQSETGTAMIRANLPADWKAGDKTGGGDHGTRNDIAIIWPPQRKPILVTAYLTECTLPDADRDAILAELGRAIADEIHGV